MSHDFHSYLANKRQAVRAQKLRVERGEAGPKKLTARVRAGDGSGVRRITIRGHELLADSGPETGGYDLGPSPVELLLGSLGGCIAHTFMVQAALREVPIDSLDITVNATSDPRSSVPTDIGFELNVTSDADEAILTALFEAAEKACPVTALLTGSHPVAASFTRTPTERLPELAAVP